MALDILRKIGLSDGEIKVYGALLDLGTAPLNRIHEKVGIERRNIYDILNKLIERGLVTYITENKRRSFRLSNPKALLGYIDEQKEDLDRTKAEVEQEIPHLIQKFEYRRLAITGEIFRGVAGVKEVWEDMLSDTIIYWIGSGRYIPKQYPQFFASWNKRRMRNGIKMFNIMRAEMRKETETEPYQLEELRFLPPAFSGNPTVICIYGQKVVNCLLGDEFFAFVIESKELAAT